MTKKAYIGNAVLWAAAIVSSALLGASDHNILLLVVLAAMSILASRPAAAGAVRGSGTGCDAAD